MPSRPSRALDLKRRRRDLPQRPTVDVSACLRWQLARALSAQLKRRTTLHFRLYLVFPFAFGTPYAFARPEVVPMDLIILVVVLCLIGFLVYLLTTKIPMTPYWAAGIQVLAALLVVLYLVTHVVRLPNLLP